MEDHYHKHGLDLRNPPPPPKENVTPPPAPEPKPKPKPKRKVKPMIIVTALLITALIAAGVFWFFGRGAGAAAWEQNYLMSDAIDYESTNITEKTEQASAHPVLGSGLTRNQIRAVYFLDTLEDIPSSSWDVSAVQNGSVMDLLHKSEEFL